MTTGAFIALIGVWVAAIVSPGPDVVQITRMGARSRSAGVWSAVGIMTGNAAWIIASLAGLSALINTHPAVLAWLQLLGGSYLAYLGVRSVTAGWALRRATTSSRSDEGLPPQPATTDPGALRSWWAGLTTNLANPKAVVFFGSVFAQFIEPGMGVGWITVVAVTLILVGLAWFVGFAFAVRALSARLARNSAVIDIVTGLIFLALAVWMLIEGVTSLL